MKKYFYSRYILSILLAEVCYGFFYGTTHFTVFINFEDPPYNNNIINNHIFAVSYISRLGKKN